MAEKESVNLLEIFAEEAGDENVQVQITAIKKLPTIAVVLDVEETKKELVPFLDQYIDTNFLHDEVLLTLAEQLENFIPFIGGYDNVDLIFKLLIKLCNFDETIVRERAVRSLIYISSTLDKEYLEKYFIPIIQKLSTEEWFTSKCSATGLFEVCYSKVSPEKQNDLRKLFKNLIQDEQPMIRRSAAENFSKFSKKIEVEDLKNEFIPVLDNLVQDTQDSVRVLAVNVAISIAARLSSQEIENKVLKFFQDLAGDKAWRVRCQVAAQVQEIQKAVGYEITDKYLVPIFQNLSKDDEPQVREEIAKNMAKFCQALKESSKEFDRIFEETVMDIVKQLHSDPNTHVRAVIAWNLMSLIALVSSEIVKKEFVPLVRNSIEQEQFGIVKENIARNLETLIDVMGTTDIMASVQKLMEDLIYKSDSNWRTRRNVLLTFTRIAKKCSKQFFNENLRDLYLRLLYDPVYAVRKTAPLVFPILIKYFGTTWGYFTTEMILPFVEDHNYLYRYIPIFVIEEVINPSLDYYNVAGTGFTYLNSLKVLSEDTNDLTKKTAIKVLTKVNILQEILKKTLEEEWVSTNIDFLDTEVHTKDNIRVYAEDVFEAFTEHEDYFIIDITKQELEQIEEEDTYLEAILYLTLKHFLKNLKKLTQDKVVNVPIKARQCLKNVLQFSSKITQECKEIWVKDLLKELEEEEIEFMKDCIQKKLNEARSLVVEEKLNFELQKLSDELEKEIGRKNPVIYVNEYEDSAGSEGKTREDLVQDDNQTVSERMEPKGNTQNAQDDPSLEKEMIEIFDNKMDTITK